MTDMKSCPFCNNHGSQFSQQPDHETAYIVCGLCGASGPKDYSTEAKAIAAWNTRPAPKAEEENANLRAENRELAMQILATDGQAQEALSDVVRLRAALQGLLDDTQPATHNCGEVGCPVAIARAALVTE